MIKLKTIKKTKLFKAIIVVIIFLMIALFLNISYIVNSYYYFKGVHCQKIEIENSDSFGSIGTDSSIDDKGVFDSYQNYLTYVNNKRLSVLLKESDFENKKYIYFVINVGCGESITGVDRIKKIKNDVTVAFDYVGSASICPSSRFIYYVPVKKDIYINSVDVEYKRVDKFRNMLNNRYRAKYQIDDKPILYMYPVIDMNVTVKIEHPELLLTTYPKYNDGWNVHVLKDGSIYDSDNKYYYALYWDENNINKIDFNEGFYVTKDNAIDFLEDKLSIIGLNDRERNEFIMYWLPKLEDNGKSLVYFELTNERELNNRLIINPKPDSMLRINMHIKKVNKKISIKEQKLNTFVRHGFSVIEWGGTIHK